MGKEKEEVVREELELESSAGGGGVVRWGKGRIIFKFVSIQPIFFYQSYQVTCVHLKGSLRIFRSAKWKSHYHQDSERTFLC